MKNQFTALLLLLGFISFVWGQELVFCPSCEELYLPPAPQTIYVHDTTIVYVSNLGDITRKFGMSFDEYVHTFLTVKDEKDTLNMLSSEKIYLNYFLPLLNTEKPLFEYRIIIREFLINLDGNNVNLEKTDHSQAESFENSTIPADYLLSIYGAEKTNTFLNSPEQIRSCLVQMFADIYHSNRKIKGVNFYFPDYTFQNKRNMSQFVKSASVVIDSSKVESIKNLSLYVSFNKKQAENNENFLDGLSSMTDSIFLFNYTIANKTLPEITVINKSDALNISLFAKLKNQFYLAKYYTKPFPETSATEFRIEDIYNLIEADYPDNQWEVFLYIIIGILVVLLILLILYFTTPLVPFYVNKNIDYIYSMLIMIFLEILILIANMFEAMSKDNVFSLNNDNRYIILFLPLLFIFIVPMMKTIGKKRNLP